MKKIFVKILFFYLTIDNALGNSKVRTIEMQRDQVALIRTSMGVATILEVPDPPNSVVVGNPEAFKVEYLDRAITLKPVSSRAKSNLYIYTDYRRYNVELVSVEQPKADYVVYLKNPKRKILEAIAAKEKTRSFEIKWKKYLKKIDHGKFILSIKRLGVGGESILIDFEIKSQGSNRGKIDPKIFWIKQLGKSITVQALMLSKLDYKPKEVAQGLIEIKTRDLNQNLPFDLEIRDKKISKITVRRISKWKYL